MKNLYHDTITELSLSDHSGFRSFSEEHGTVYFYGDGGSRGYVLMMETKRLGDLFVLKLDGWKKTQLGIEPYFMELFNLSLDYHGYDSGEDFTDEEFIRYCMDYGTFAPNPVIDELFDELMRKIEYRRLEAKA